MGWFIRNARASGAGDFNRDLARYLRAAGVDRALDALSGPYGLRRYLVFFEHDGEHARVTDLVAQPLAWGGGPPPYDETGERVAILQRALEALHKNMRTSFSWERGALGVYRDARGTVNLMPFFDEDADVASLESIAVPPAPGHPMETRDYEDLVEVWAARMGPIRARTSAFAHDYDLWEILDDTRLVLVYGDPEQPEDVQRHRCRVIATFEPRWNRLTWQAPPLPFKDDVYSRPQINVDWSGALELGTLTTTRLGAEWMFAQSTDDDRLVVMAAVFG